MREPRYKGGVGAVGRRVVVVGWGEVEEKEKKNAD